MQEQIYIIKNKPYISVHLTNEQIVSYVYSCSICQARDKNAHVQCLASNIIGFVCKPYTRLVELNEGV